MTDKTYFEVEFPIMNNSTSEGTFIEVSNYYLTRD